MQGSIKIRNAKVPITASPEAFEELTHIEQQISNMSVMPDFGYEKDNFLLGRAPGADVGWKTLVELISNRDKFEWIKNHIEVVSIKEWAKKTEA